MLDHLLVSEVEPLLSVVLTSAGAETSNPGWFASFDSERNSVTLYGPTDVIAELAARLRSLDTPLELPTR